MAVLIWMFIFFVVCCLICQGNIGLGFLLFLVVFIGVNVAYCQEAKEKETKKAKIDRELEATIYNGLRDDWYKHKINGNHYVPAEYVAYMEQNDKAWEFWAKARTNEILIDKGYMGSNMKCLSEYDEANHQRVDYTTHKELYKDFESTYLPLIKYYNKTNEMHYNLATLPSVIERKRRNTKAILDGYEINRKD